MTKSVVEKFENESGTKLSELVKQVKEKNLTKHKQILDFLKETHGLSYGYANTLTFAVRDVIEGVKSDDELLEEQYAGAKADLKPIYDEVISEVKKFGKDVEIAPKKAYVSLRRKTQFGIVQPSTKTRMDIGLIIKDKKSKGRLEEAGKWNAMCTHRVRVEAKKDIDSELVNWLREAYENAA